MPQAIGGFEAIQTIKTDGAASTPYVLTAVLPVPVNQPGTFGVRKGDVADQWFPTSSQLIARTKSHDYYEVQARIDSGSQTLFSVDDLSDPALQAAVESYDHDGILQPRSTVTINHDAWVLLNTPLSGALKLKFYAPAVTSAAAEVDLFGGYGVALLSIPEGKPDRMWTSPRQTNGYHRWGPHLRTVYKHVPVVPGGALGYLHIFATVGADSPEIQFEINWHNGGFEERLGGAGGGVGQTELDPEAGNTPSTDRDTPRLPLGQYRGGDIIFARVLISGLAGMSPAEGFSGTWTVTPRLQHGGGAADTSFNIGLSTANEHAMVRQVNFSNPNERHILPITFERPFRFAVHMSSVTPYAKRVVGMADWTVGGFGFSPIGVPDLTNWGGAAIDLTTEANVARQMLKELKPYTCEGEGTGANDFVGMLPVSPFLPGSWSPYGGLTSGSGMWPYNGMKAAWTAERDALEIMMVEQLRNRARTYGALYGNVSGHPAVATDFQQGDRAPWARFDRRFEKQGGVPQDQPFGVSSHNPSTPFPGRRKVHLAAYNPGPTFGGQTEQPLDPTPNTPDWWMGSAPGAYNADTNPLAPRPLDEANTIMPLELNLAHTLPPNQGDLAVKVIMQIHGAGAFNNTKSITLRIEGTGEFDIFATEDVVLTGPASDPPLVQSKVSVASWKTISRLAIVAKSGTLLATELLTVGRSGAQYADYHGTDSITAIDGQHAIRYHASNKALATLAWDPLAMLYLFMDAADARMTHWEGSHGRWPGNHNGAHRGNQAERGFAWATDMICARIAFDNARLGQTLVDFYWRRWTDRVNDFYLDSQMPNHLWQLVTGKEFKEMPTGGSSLESEPGPFWGLSGREMGYTVHALAMILNVKGRDYSALKQRLANMALGIRDVAWAVNPSGTLSGSVGNYLPLAISYPPGSTIPRPSLQGGSIPAGDNVTYYLTSDDVPSQNPISGTLINPGRPGGPGFPTVDDDYYVAELTGVALGAGGAALTILNGGTSSTGGPTQLALKINGASTFTGAKRRTFRVTGTNPWGVAVDDGYFVAERDGNTILQNVALSLAHLNNGSVIDPAFRWRSDQYIEVLLLAGDTYTSSKHFALSIVGARADGQVVTEVLQMRGNGAKEQRFRTCNKFYSVSSITPVLGTLWSQVNDPCVKIGTPSVQPFPTLVSTEKFAVGTPTKFMVVLGKGSNPPSSQTFHSYQHFKTITEIKMLTNAQAARTGNPDLGSLVVGELFRFGVPVSGLRQQSNLNPGLEANPIGQEPYHLGYTLAILRLMGAELGDAAAADTCILRYTGEASLTASLALLLGGTWTENGGGSLAPANAPMYQWLPLIWALQYASLAVDVVADFEGKDSNGDQTGAAPLNISFKNLTVGAEAVAWDWNFGDGSPHSTFRNPLHQYAAPGSYTVTLQAKDAAGALLDSATKPNYITAT